MQSAYIPLGMKRSVKKTITQSACIPLGMHPKNKEVMANTCTQIHIHTVFAVQNKDTFLAECRVLDCQLMTVFHPITQ